MTECSKPPAEDRCRYSEEAARSAVKQVFAILGVDVDDPAQVEDFRKDLRFGRMLRCAGDKGFLAVVAAVCLAIAAATWTGIVSKVHTP